MSLLVEAAHEADLPRCLPRKRWTEALPDVLFLRAIVELLRQSLMTNAWIELLPSLAIFQCLIVIVRVFKRTSKAIGANSSALLVIV